MRINYLIKEGMVLMKKNNNEVENKKMNKKANKKQELQLSDKNKAALKKRNISDYEEDEGLQVVSTDNIDNIEKKVTKKKKNYVFGKKLRIVITVLAVIVFCGAGYQLISILKEYKQGEDLYDNLTNSFTSVNVARDNEEDQGEDYSDGNIMPYNKVDVDFDGLKKANSDVVGWIQFEHVDISYPIVKGSDNSYYLTHTVTKTENKAGAIFMDHNNASDFSDMNTIIYGHNMKNGSMFGLMGQYKNAEFYLGRECFWIYTPDADYRYMIFSCYEPKADDANVYTFWSEPCEDYGKYLENAKNASKYHTEVSALSQDDKIVTLSTCTSRGSDYRFVVQGRLIETVQK